VVTDDGVPALSDSEYLTITVGIINRAPVLDPIGDQVVDEGQSLTVSLSAMDPDGDNVTFNATGLLPFCSLYDAGDGTATFTCTPGPDDAGLSVVTITVTDNGVPSLSDSEVFTVTVINVNRAPVLEHVSDPSVDAGETLALLIAAFDADSELLSFIATGLPKFCSLMDNGNNSADLSCSPAAGDDGEYEVVVTVTDTGVPQLSDTESFTIQVRGSSVTIGGVTFGHGGGGGTGLLSIIALLLLVARKRPNGGLLQPERQP